MKNLFVKSGFIFARECAFYDLQDDAKTKYDGKKLIKSVLESIPLGRYQSKMQTKFKNWSLHSSSLNLNRKKGRAIAGRYQDQNK